MKAETIVILPNNGNRYIQLSKPDCQEFGERCYILVPWLACPRMETRTVYEEKNNVKSMYG